MEVYMMSAAAGTEKRWRIKCLAASGRANSWKEGGRVYFYQLDPKPQPDGAIVGSIETISATGYCRRIDDFRIEGDGTVTKAPIFLKTGHA
jgi:hypothetical protein